MKTFFKACILVPIVASWLSLTPQTHAQNGLLREVYEDIFSLSQLTNSPAYPSSPDSVSVIPEFEAPGNAGDLYGQRVRGYLVAPVDGNYVFWISSDDGSELLLSTDANAANRVSIARVNRFTGPRQWDAEPGQRSAPIALVKDQRYYIEALHVDGFGGDHLAVRWQLPDGTIEEPIPNNRLFVELIAPQIVTHPASQTVTEGETATFSVRLNNVGPVSYQWLRGSVEIPDATNSFYSITTTFADNNARFRVRTTNLFGTETSNEATLLVERDTTPPVLLSAINQGTTDLVTLLFSEPLSDRSATNAANFFIADDIEIFSATLSPDGRSVLLRTTPLARGAYTVTVNDIEDRADLGNLVDQDSRARFTVGFTPIAGSALNTGNETIGPSSRRTGLAISEIMYNPPANGTRNLEFIEIYNSLDTVESLGGFRISGTVDFTFPEGTFIPGRGYLLVAKVPTDLQAVYGLSRVQGPYQNALENSEGIVRLENDQGAVLLEAHYGTTHPWPAAADGGGHSLVLGRPSYGEADPRAWTASEQALGSPGKVEPAPVAAPFRSLVINEILAHTDLPVKDFIEIYNYSTQAVNIAGMVLTDNPATNKFIVPANRTIPALGFAFFTEDELNFSLSARGETVFLYSSTNKTRVIDALRFDAQQNGVSLGRYPDGASRLRQLVTRTPGVANTEPRRADVVINEIMFNPVSGNADDEFIELYNRSGREINLSGWQLQSGVNFTFPNLTILPADGYLVVGRNSAKLLQNHPTLTANTVVGNYTGKLSNSRDHLVLSRGDRITDTNANNTVVTNIQQVVVDEVAYFENGRWGKWSDGGGSSLELIDPNSDNDFASNWADSDETRKSTWTHIEHRGTLDHGMTNFTATNPSQNLHVILMGSGEALLDNVLVLNQTNLNVVGNSNFVSGANGWTATGTHEDTSWDAQGSSDPGSLHIRATERGDTSSNRIRTRLSPGLQPLTVATIRAQARWLRGNPEILLRLHGNYLEAAGTLTVPTNLGTPGAPNSRRILNSGPTISHVTHSPVLPSANQRILVSAQINDVDNIGAATLAYRIDSATNSTRTNVNRVAMSYNGAGYYSAEIPGQPVGTLVAFHIQASDANLMNPGASRFPNDAPTREALVRVGEQNAPGTFASYHLWLTSSNITRWRTRDKSSNKGLDATFVYNNQRVIYNMDTLYSGSPFHWGGYNGPTNNTANYVLNFPTDDLFLGQSDFVLNLPSNMGSDQTAIREQVFFWMAAELGQPYNYRRFHHFYINGVKRGPIFEDAQQPNGDFVAEWVPQDTDGDLFKIEDWFEYNDGFGFRNIDASLEPFYTTDLMTGQREYKQERYRWNWRKRAVNDSAHDYSELFRLLDAVNETDPELYTTRVEELVDIDEWMAAMALRHVVGDWDAYGSGRGKNMYAYKPEDGKWLLFHWDVAFSFGLGDGPRFDNLFYTIDPTVERMYNHPPFRRAYLRTLLEAANGPMAPGRIYPIIDAKSKALQDNGIPVGSPDQIDNGSGYSLKGWISERRDYILEQVASAAASFAITSNNGADFSTNRNQITITGSAPVDVKSITINGIEYPVTWTSVTTFAVRYALSGASNTLLLQGWDRYGNPIAGVQDTVTVNFTGNTEQAENRVVISEIFYNANETQAEFVELHNTSRTFAFDLSGYRLNGLDITFAGGTIIQPGGFLVVASNEELFRNTYGDLPSYAGTFNGDLDNEGETLSLVRLDATGGTNDVVVERVTFDAMRPWPVLTPGQTVSLQIIDPVRDSSRVGNFSTAAPSPGATNSVRATFTAFPLVWVNEVLPHNMTSITDASGRRGAWVELYNSGNSGISLNGLFLTDDYNNLTRWAFPSTATIGAKQFKLVWLDSGFSTATELHANFTAATSTGTIALMGVQNGTPVVYDYLNYQNLPMDRSFGALPDGQSHFRRRFFATTPGAANSTAPEPVEVFINEWMAGNTLTIADGGDYEDWFELYNGGSEGVDLSNYTLSDDATNITKFTIPNGTIIPAGGFLMVWADEETGQNNGTNSDLHVNFKLSLSGESIILANPAGQVVDSVTFGRQSNDVSQGRLPDGSAALTFFDTPTPRASNTGRPSGLVVSAAKEGNLIRISWDAEPNVTYMVEFKNDLTETIWQLLRTVTPTSAEGSTTDTTNLAHRFYRVVRPTP